MSRSTAGLVFTLGAMAVAVASGACRPEPAPTAEAGRALYGENGCASCHGARGYGDGPVAKTLAPPPRDFRDASAFKRGIDVPSIAQTLADGLSEHGSGMPRFNHLSEGERRSIALFVISLCQSHNEGMVRK